MSTTNGPVNVTVPRDRNATFEPRIVPKHARRLGNLDDMILSLCSRGMTTRDIEAHLLEVYGVSASRELISNVTEVVVDEIKAWQCRPLDEVYPIVYVDGIRIRVRDAGVVTTKVAYLAIGVDVEGRKHALGCWIQDSEGAKFWAKVLTDLRNRGVADTPPRPPPVPERQRILRLLVKDILIDPRTSPSATTSRSANAPNNPPDTDTESDHPRIARLRLRRGTRLWDKSVARHLTIRPAA